MASELTGKIVKRGVEKDNASTAHRKKMLAEKLRGHFSSSTKYSINQLDGAKSNATPGMERGKLIEPEIGFEVEKEIATSQGSCQNRWSRVKRAVAIERTEREPYQWKRGKRWQNFFANKIC